ncbi:MAG: HAMP domain-containing sensor histidine kinase [Planctomycetota bacterium]
MLKPLLNAPKESRVLAVVVVTLLVQVLVLSLFGLAALRGQVASQESDLREISGLVLERNLVDEMAGRVESARERATVGISELSVDVPRLDPLLGSRVRSIVEQEGVYVRAFLLDAKGGWYDARQRVLRPADRAVQVGSPATENPFEAFEEGPDPAIDLERVRSLAGRSDERFRPWSLRLIARLARAAGRDEEAFTAWGAICREHPTTLDTLVFPPVAFGPQAARLAAELRVARLEAGTAGPADVILDLVRLREILSVNLFQLDEERRRWEEARFEALVTRAHPRLDVTERVQLADAVRAVRETEDAFVILREGIGTLLGRVARGDIEGGVRVTAAAAGGPELVHAVPVRGPGGVTGAVVFQVDVAGIRTGVLPDVLAGLPLPDGVAATVRTADGKPVAGPAPVESAVLARTRMGEALPFWHAVVFLEDQGRLERRIGNARLLIYGVMALSIAGMLAAAWFLLRTVRRELRTAEMKSDFLSNVTHELKTPLTSIRMFVETLEEGRVKDEGERQEYLGVISREAERLSGLIQRVLDLARFEGGRKTSLRLRETDTGSLLRDTAEIFRRRLTGEDTSVRVEIPDGLPSTEMDPEAIREAVLNLLSNAEKYGGKTIRLSATAADGALAIEIADDGIGISEAEQSRIFTKFYRSEDTLARKVEGSGLGLALVAEIVGAHGGRVDVTSRPGEGSRFTISLPVTGEGS